MFLFYAIQFEPVKYNTYEYPGWAHGVGILMALSSVGIIPCYMIYLYIVTPGNTMQVSLNHPYQHEHEISRDVQGLH